MKFVKNWNEEILKEGIIKDKNVLEIDYIGLNINKKGIERLSLR